MEPFLDTQSKECSVFDVPDDMNDPFPRGDEAPKLE